MRKTCGKPVHAPRLTWVRTHFVCTTSRHQMQNLANDPTPFPRFPHGTSPALPTTNLFKITPVRQHFSPLSTALIITTTIYK